jgi:hypothetical protein
VKKLIHVTKIKKLIKVYDVLNDINNDISDEELLEKYALNWKQLEKVYRKLFHGKFLTEAQMQRRIELRSGRGTSHIAFADIHETGRVYECGACNFHSVRHFSTCPRCHSVNLRRLPLQRRRPISETPLSAALSGMYDDRFQYGN